MNTFFIFYPSRPLYAQNVCVCVWAHMYVSVCGQHWILYVWSKALDGPLILFPTISVRRRKGGDEEDRLVAQ